MALPIPNQPVDHNHLKWIIHHGKFEKDIEWKTISALSPDDCLVVENLNHTEYDGTFWEDVVTPYQDKMLLCAIAYSGKAPIVRVRVSTDSFIDCKNLKKLCFVFHRNDNGRKLDTMTREIWVYVRDKNGDIAARSKLTGLHGYDIRGRIDLPDDLNEFRVEIKEEFNCSYAPDTFVPCCVTCISDMWLEEQDPLPYQILNQHDSSDPDESEPGPGPDPSAEYATAITPEVESGKPYTKIWFNEQGLIYRGDYYNATQIPMSATDQTSIYDKLTLIEKHLPSTRDPKRVVISNNEGALDVYTGMTTDDLPYLAYGLGEDTEKEIP